MCCYACVLVLLLLLLLLLLFTWLPVVPSVLLLLWCYARCVRHEMPLIMFGMMVPLVVVLTMDAAWLPSMAGSDSQACPCCLLVLVPFDGDGVGQLFKVGSVVLWLWWFPVVVPLLV